MQNYLITVEWVYQTKEEIVEDVRRMVFAFQSLETAFLYHNLLRNYLRFKPYADCRGARKQCNGFAPGELCGAVLTTNDCLKNAVTNFYAFDSSG